MILSPIANFIAILAVATVASASTTCGTNLVTNGKDVTINVGSLASNRGDPVREWIPWRGSGRTPAAVQTQTMNLAYSHGEYNIVPAEGGSFLLRIRHDVNPATYVRIESSTSHLVMTYLDPRMPTAGYWNFVNCQACTDDAAELCTIQNVKYGTCLTVVSDVGSNNEPFITHAPCDGRSGQLHSLKGEIPYVRN